MLISAGVGKPVDLDGFRFDSVGYGLKMSRAEIGFKIFDPYPIFNESD